MNKNEILDDADNEYLKRVSIFYRIGKFIRYLFLVLNGIYLLMLPLLIIALGDWEEEKDGSSIMILGLILYEICLLIPSKTLNTRLKTLSYIIISFFSIVSPAIYNEIMLPNEGDISWTITIGIAIIPMIVVFLEKNEY